MHQHRYQNPITRPLGFNPIKPANLDLIMTLALLFLACHSGHYDSHAALRKRITAWLDRENDYGRDLTWLDGARDVDVLVDRVLALGGVTIRKLLLLEWKREGRDQGTRGMKGPLSVEMEGEKEG